MKHLLVQPFPTSIFCVRFGVLFFIARFAQGLQVCFHVHPSSSQWGHVVEVAGLQINFALAIDAPSILLRYLCRLNPCNFSWPHCVPLSRRDRSRRLLILGIDLFATAMLTTATFRSPISVFSSVSTKFRDGQLETTSRADLRISGRKRHLLNSKLNMPMLANRPKDFNLVASPSTALPSFAKRTPPLTLRVTLCGAGMCQKYDFNQCLKWRLRGKR